MSTSTTTESQHDSTATPPETASFAEKDGRLDAMREDLDAWIEYLADLVEQARGEQQFKRLLEVQAKFHDYSTNNQLLILRQMPDATRVAGFNTWKEMGRYVQQGESAIWIWAPLTSAKCPNCGNAPSYHERGKVDCDYHEDVDPDTWSECVVGFKPVPVYDVSQTDGEPLPSVDADAEGNPGPLLGALEAAAEDLPLHLDVVPEEEWDHGTTKGVCDGYSPNTAHPVIEVQAVDNEADLCLTIVHEIAHALLHYTVREGTPERDKREVEAEAVGYAVCQHYGLDASGSRFYLASWSDEAAEDLRERIDRIQDTAGDVIEAVERHLPEDAGIGPDAEASGGEEVGA